MADNAVLLAQPEKKMKKKHDKTEAALVDSQATVVSQARRIASLSTQVDSLETQLTATRRDAFRQYKRGTVDGGLANAKGQLVHTQEQPATSQQTVIDLVSILNQADLRGDTHETTLGQIAKLLIPNGEWRHIARTGPDAVGKAWNWCPRGSSDVRPATSGPMEPFPYLPVELVDLIVSLADKKDKYTLALVQRSWFKMFARVDKLWSRGTITEANFAAFLTAKMSLSSKESLKDHLSSLFETEALSLVRHCHTDERLSPDCPILRDAREQLARAKVLNLHLVLTGSLATDYKYWHNLLCVLDPKTFTILSDKLTLPTMSRMKYVHFPSAWTHLKTTVYFGAGSIAGLKGNDELLSPPTRIPTSHNFVRRRVTGEDNDGLVDPITALITDEKDNAFTVDRLQAKLFLAAFATNETHIGLETTWGPRPSLRPRIR